MGELTHGSLFSGIGGFELGAQWAGIKTLWNCEIEPFQRSILKKHFPNAKQYTDIKELKNPEYVDIISGGFPCQDISSAGGGNGISGEQSGLWSEMFRICWGIRPKYIIIENSPNLTIRGFEQVLCNLSEIGYNAEWQCLQGIAFGLPHFRKRIFCIAYRMQAGWGGTSQNIFTQQGDMGKHIKPYRPTYGDAVWLAEHYAKTNRCVFREPKNTRKNDGLPREMDEVAAYGNAIIPQIAQYLFECIKQHNLQIEN